MIRVTLSEDKAINVIFAKDENSFSAGFEGDNAVTADVMLLKYAQSFSAGFAPTTEVTTDDHSKLKNRDQSDQHPINAVTNLEKQLNNRPTLADVITNTEIEQMLNLI